MKTSIFLLGYKQSYLGQCRASGCSCCYRTSHTRDMVSKLVRSHFFPGSCLPFPTPESCETVGLCLASVEVYCTVAAPHCSKYLVGSLSSKGRGVQMETGMLAGFWSCLALGWVRELDPGICHGGLAFAQVCSPGEIYRGCCAEQWEKSCQKCQLCDMCCGTGRSCSHCCLAPCQHYFWKAV